MAIPPLTDLYIDETYPRLVQTNDTRTEFADGLGNPITFGTTPTGSLLTTASAAGNTITFTKGDGSTFPVTVTGGGTPGGPNTSIQFNDNGTFSGSTNLTFNSASNALILTGSFNVSGSTTQVGNNNLFGNTTLSGSIIISGSTISPTVQVYGNVTHDGYIRFNPVSTNVDNSISASYIYVSGSTNDLYFTQNGGGYGNTTRLRWLEGNLYTGLLHGGLITTQSSTVYQIGSGSGIIVTLNTSISDDPYPTVQFLSWPNLSSSIAPLTASYDQQFVAISSSAGVPVIKASGIPYTDGEYNTFIPIGIIVHQNRSTINGVQTFPGVAYGWKQRSFDFIKAFGPLKIAGYTLAQSGSSTRGLVLSGGTSWVDGRNYVVDPNNPSYIVEATGTTTSKIFRYYQSGSNWQSTWNYNTNAGAGFTDIDPTQYSNAGTLTAVATNHWSIQRVFYFPNSATKALYVYYGNAQYDNKTDAIAAILTETFNEAPNTTANAIFIGYMVLRHNADFTNTNTYEFRAAGLFRSSGIGGASGGGGATTLAGLTDVSLTSPSYGDLLMYDSTYWYNTKTLSGSYTLSGSLTTNDGVSVQTLTASIVSASQFTGSLYGTASYATTASYALNGGVTQLLAGANITLSPTNGLGQVTITSTGGAGIYGNTATGSYGSFYDTTTQTNPVANVNRSMSLNTTDISNGVLISGSTNPYNTYIKTQNAGVYDIQFSAQLEKTNVGNTSTVYIWLRKNGVDLSDTNTVVELSQNGKGVAAWNWFVNAAANDYYQIMWAADRTDIQLSATTPAIGPTVPSVIVTANRVDQFLSNTGSFSGSFNGSHTGTFSGSFTGSLSGTSSWANNATTASYTLTASAAGDNTYIQYNNNGVLGAVNTFTYNGGNAYINEAIVGNTDVIGVGDHGLFANGDRILAAVHNDIIYYSQGDYKYYLNNPLHSFTNNVQITGSLTVSGSSTFTNIGPAIFSGSVTSTNGFTGSLEGTASWATNFVSASNYVLNSATSSFITTGSSSATQGITGSLSIRSALATGTAFQVLSGSSTILYAGTNLSQTRVGIRTSTPQYSFDVNSNTNFTPEEHSGYVRISPGQSSTWNNPTYFQTSFGSTLMLNNAYYTASSGQFIRATNGYAAGIQLEPSLGGIELFTAPYGTAGTAFDSFTSRISITNSGSVGINNTSPSYSLDVSGSGRFLNGLIITGSLNAPNITGSLQGTASWATNASTASYVVTALTASYVTASNVIGTVTSASYALSASYAANGGVTQIIAGTNITISPTNGLGAVTINSSGGAGGAGANITASFTNQSTWTFTHALNNRGVVVQTYDTSWNQIIPENITLTDANTATITFPTNESGYAIATLGGVTSIVNASSSISASFASTASYVTPYEGAWISYTPIWSTPSNPQPSIGNGTLTGAYKQIGKTVFVRVRLEFGTTTTGGTGDWRFNLPVTASSAAGIQFPCSILDAGVTWYQATVNGQYGGETFRTSIIGQSAGANSSQGITATFPITWGNLDSLQFNGSYEAA